jgi:hypothetical protein
MQGTTIRKKNCLYENVLRSLLRTLARYTNSEFVERSRHRRKSFKMRHLDYKNIFQASKC